MRLLYAVLLAGCQLAFPVFPDEDGDGEEDASDRCPAFADESAGDQDGDTIPDDCDLRDTVAGDTRVFFSFVDGKAPQVTGELAVRDGSAVIGGDRATVLDLGVEAAEARVELAIAILEEFPAAFAPRLRVTIANGAFACDVGFDAGVGFVALDNGLDRTKQTFAGELGTARLTLARLVGLGGQRGDLFCSLARGSDTVTAAAQVVELAPPPSGTIAIETQNVRARVDYIYAVFAPAIRP